MRYRRGGSIALAAIATLALAGTASAAPAQPVEIDLHVEFEGTETFTADGFCPSGSAETFFSHQGGGAGRAVTFHLFKVLTCDDGSGTLAIRVDANAVDGFGGTIGGWHVVAGTGDYEGVRGGGLIVGTGFDGGIDDHYEGMLTG